MMDFVQSVLLWLTSATVITSTTAYDDLHLCQGPPGEIIDYPGSPQKRFGPLLEMESGRSIVIVFATNSTTAFEPGMEFAMEDLTSELKGNSWPERKHNLLVNDTENDQYRRFDCFFGVRHQLPGGNVTVGLEWWGMENKKCGSFVQIFQSSEKYMVPLAEKSGSYLLRVRNFIPLKLHVSVCEWPDNHFGMVLLISAQGDSNAVQVTSSFHSPFVMLLLALIALPLVCCCFAGAFCNRKWNGSNRQRISANNNNIPTVSQNIDNPSVFNVSLQPTACNPPAYDELYPNGKVSKHEELPTYDECVNRTSTVV